MCPDLLFDKYNLIEFGFFIHFLEEGSVMETLTVAIVVAFLMVRIIIRTVYGKFSCRCEKCGSWDTELSDACAIGGDGIVHTHSICNKCGHPQHYNKQPIDGST